MATYARGTLDCEADGDGVACLWRNVDVLAGHIGRAVVVEGQQVNLVRHHGFWDHVVRTESCPAQSWAARSWGDARMHTHVFGEEGHRPGLLAVTQQAASRRRGVSGDRRLTGGLELCLAGVNMESMEYGERNTESCTAVEGNRAGQTQFRTQDSGEGKL